MLIVKILEKGAIGLLLTLDAIIYDLIGKAYNIFMAIAGISFLLISSLRLSQFTLSSPYSPIIIAFSISNSAL